ncbi:hypothetical protein A2U01_0094093, partial [Trifolium medium]|nr:hypothetical protein [Trifolium medium]
MKVYGKPADHCYKVEVREEEVDEVNLISEWIEDRGKDESWESEESIAETEGGEIASYTAEE